MIYSKDRFYLKEHFVSFLKTFTLDNITYRKKKVEYINLAISFDIEVSSFYENKEKRAIMYAFTLCVNEISFLGRSWDDFNFYIENLIETFNLSKERKLIIYIHNLSYEFQFLRKRLNFKKVFLIGSREVAYAESEEIIFKCSYLLSGYSLSKVAENLTSHKIEKLVGDLDYSLIRHSKTPLKEDELHYLLNDGLIVVYYIKEELEKYKKLTSIPLTKTGKVREYVRKNCYFELDENGKKIRNPKSRKFTKYRRLMNSLKIKSLNEYLELKNALLGGFTHASCSKVGKVYNNVYSYDFTSSYPAVMLSEMYPMSKGELIRVTSKEELEFNLKNYCCLFEIEIRDVKSKINYEHFLSFSRCLKVENAILDNGRIVECSMLRITLTDVDFKIVSKHYSFSSLKIANFRRYQRGYLPKDFILSIIKLYKDKTELKDVGGKEVEYLNSKEMINSCYGMCVTDILRDELVYEVDTDTFSERVKSKEEMEKALIKYNNSKTRFLSYAWGVWITAYARFNLWTGIDELKEDYIYSDTDSLKFLNLNKHINYFNDYNINIENKLKRMCDFYFIDYSLLSPKTIKGKIKKLGVWDYEGEYQKFKTLGAKRYMTLKNNKYSFTIAGTNKKYGIPYLLKEYGDNTFEEFKDGLTIPSDYTGKNCLTYLDFETKGKVKDYLGKEYKYHEYNSIHMEKIPFTLSLSEDFKNYLLNIQTKQYIG